MPMAPFDSITAVYTPCARLDVRGDRGTGGLPPRATSSTSTFSRFSRRTRTFSTSAREAPRSRSTSPTDAPPTWTSSVSIWPCPQVKRATRRMRHYGERVRFRVGDATRLDFADGVFDGVISYGSIKHWSSRETGLTECMRVLKPAGPLLITDADRSTSFDDAERFIENYRTPPSSRRHQSRDLPHVDRGPLHQPRRGA